MTWHGVDCGWRRATGLMHVLKLLGVMPVWAAQLGTAQFQQDHPLNMHADALYMRVQSPL